HGIVARLGARVRHLRSGVLRASAETVFGLLARRPRRATRELGQLGPGGRHRARERAGDRRAWLALRRPGREEAAVAMVFAHHALCAGTVGGARPAGALAG